MSNKINIIVMSQVCMHTLYGETQRYEIWYKDTHFWGFKITYMSCVTVYGTFYKEIFNHVLVRPPIQPSSVYA